LQPDLEQDRRCRPSSSTLWAGIVAAVIVAHLSVTRRLAVASARAHYRS